jgi:hypothetical protein
LDALGSASNDNANDAEVHSPSETSKAETINDSAMSNKRQKLGNYPMREEVNLASGEITSIIWKAKLH